MEQGLGRHCLPSKNQAQALEVNSRPDPQDDQVSLLSLRALRFMMSRFLGAFRSGGCQADSGRRWTSRPTGSTFGRIDGNEIERI